MGFRKRVAVALMLALHACALAVVLDMLHRLFTSPGSCGACNVLAFLLLAASAALIIDSLRDVLCIARS